MNALILAEHDNKQLNPSTLNTLSAAFALKSQPTMLVIGKDCQRVAEQAASLKGVMNVIHIDSPDFEHPLAEAISQIIIDLSDSYDYFIAGATTFGKNIMPRVAALLDVAQISDVTQIIDESTFEHPIYAGNAIQTVKLLDSKKVLTIRPTAFETVKDSQSVCHIEQINKEVSQLQTEYVSQELSKSDRPDLSSARVVVSGGRGLQDAEKFKLIESLADTLEGAVGASRAAVDAGFVPNDYQVGQTGKVVAPELYIAIGISGAIQHLAGMKDSKVIVAINKDEDAPIFQIADYGLVGDLFELVPELIEQLK